MSTDLEKTTEKSFLPTGYKVPDKSKQFMKLMPGDNKIRFLSSPIIGNVIFNSEKKPVRKSLKDGEFTAAELVEINPKIDAETGKPEAPKHFWIALIWDYDDGAPKVLDITQITIIKPLYNLANDEDWGDLRNFDVVINKTGFGKTDTEYSVTPKPAKPLTKEVQENLNKILAENLVNLNNVWHNEYPFLTYNY